MGAYNWILITARCPSCSCEVQLRCQTHIASDYGGDESGRFHDREYRVGDPLKWWPQQSPKYAKWRVNGIIGGSGYGDFDTECCYTACPECKTNLYAVIEFEGPRAVNVKEIGFEDQWPQNYFK